jgi:hypothetical protein
MFGICLFDRRGEIFRSWRREGHKDEEDFLCVNCDTSWPVPRSTRVFYRTLSPLERVASRYF